MTAHTQSADEPHRSGLVCANGPPRLRRAPYCSKRRQQLAGHELVSARGLCAAVLRFKVACCSGQGCEAGLPLPWPRTDDDMLMLCYGAFARSFRLVDEFRRLSWLGAVGKALGLKLCADMHGRSARAAGQSSRARHRYGRRLRSGDQPTQKSLEGLIDGRPSSCNT